MKAPNTLSNAHLSNEDESYWKQHANLLSMSISDGLFDQSKIYYKSFNDNTIDPTGYR